jgi:hypothetical protein
MLEDAKTAIGSLDPLTRFGSSAFGPVEARVVSADGAVGDWIPLGTLVRLPGFKDLRCPHSPSKPCTLTGTNLFLAASIGASPDFEGATDVPPDFTGTQLSVPHPVNGMLYLRLRDDPPTVQTLTLPVTLMSTAMANRPATIPRLRRLRQPRRLDGRRRLGSNAPGSGPGRAATTCGGDEPVPSKKQSQSSLMIGVQRLSHSSRRKNAR